MFFIFMVAGMSSCRVFPYMYFPDAPNSTIANEKNQVKASVYLDEYSGYGLKASYAIDSHIVVFADGYNMNRSEPSNHLEKFQHFIGTAGGGYYTKIGGDFNLTVLAGGSYGYTNSSTRNIFRDSTEDLHIRASLFRLLGEVHLGLETKNVSVSAGVRLTHLVPGGNYLATHSDSLHSEIRVVNMPLNKPSLFIDPAFMLGLGLKPLKITWEFGLSYQISGYNVPEYYGNLYFPFYSTIGITVSLGGN